MTLQEATDLAIEQAKQYNLPMIVVKDDLSEDEDKYNCCAEMYRPTLYPDIHKEYWQIVSKHQ